MTDDLLTGVTLFSAIGCGLVAGIFYAFSTFVMRALDRLPSAQGVAAMQSINVAVLNPAFALAFGGTFVACLALAASAVFRWGEPESGLLLAGSLLYTVGCVGVTVAFHVPRNVALAELDPTGPDVAASWRSFVTTWTVGNHVRTAASLAAAVLLVVAL
jgi:uncharacterized membrane protein